MKFWKALLICSLVSGSAAAEFDDIEAELNAVHQKEEPPPPEIIDEVKKPQPVQTQPARKLPAKSQAPAASKAPVSRSQSTGMSVDQELRTQDQYLQKKRQYEDQTVNPDRNVDRFPSEEPLFKRPPGPKAGGTLRVEHPRAADGLLRINKDGSYQYKTKIVEKSKSGALKLGQMTPPKLKSEDGSISFDTMYGSDDIFAANFEYEWQPFRGFGSLGLVMGVGFATTKANGYFRNQTTYRTSTRSEEEYSLFIVPLSAFIQYRFEYMRRQWIVPFVMGGGTFYGLMELRSDGEAPTLAGAPAAGAGGGVLFSLSRLDSAGAFTLSQEYGIADMWLVVEARHMEGLSEDIDFTNDMVSAGIQVDF